MKNILSLKEMHAELAPNYNVTIKAEEVEAINIPRVAGIAHNLGYTEFARLGYFIKNSYLEELVNEVREAIDSYDGQSPLEYNWLDGSDEWVIHVGSVVIVDGLTEEVASSLEDLLSGELEGFVYICEDCDEIHEDETDTCDTCHGDCRIVARSDMDMD